MMHILVICLEDFFFFFFFFDLLVFLGDFVAPCWLGSSKDLKQPTELGVWAICRGAVNQKSPQRMC